MDKKWKDRLKRCCLDRWDNTHHNLILLTMQAKEDFALIVVNAELESMFPRYRIDTLTLQEDKKLFKELVLHLLSNR